MNPRPVQSRSTRTRVVRLIVCLLGGGAAGAIGHAVTGDAAWYLALPAVLAAAWWFLADPERCLTDESEEPGRRRPR